MRKINYMDITPRLSFKEYIESKNKLKIAGDDYPRYKLDYEVNKYCKLPILEDYESDQKTYISLKPKDRISILWEKIDFVRPTVKYILIKENDKETKYYLSWSLPKFSNWLKTSTFEK